MAAQWEHAPLKDGKVPKTGPMWIPAPPGAAAAAEAGKDVMFAKGGHFSLKATAFFKFDYSYDQDGCKIYQNRTRSDWKMCFRRCGNLEQCEIGFPAGPDAKIFQMFPAFQLCPNEIYVEVYYKGALQHVLSADPRQTMSLVAKKIKRMFVEAGSFTLQAVLKICVGDKEVVNSKRMSAVCKEAQYRDKCTSGKAAAAAKAQAKGPEQAPAGVARQRSRTPPPKSQAETQAQTSSDRD